jgi:arsenite methyltransferase
MFQDDIQAMVRDAYQGLAAPGGPATRFYDRSELDTLPDGAREWALGVGNPVRHAGLRPGDTVVDLGCGSGIDVLLAADRVGERGRVVGVDFLASMVERAGASQPSRGIATQRSFARRSRTWTCRTVRSTS